MITQQNYKDFWYIDQALKKAKREGCPRWVEPSNFAKWLEALELMHKNMVEGMKPKVNKLANAIRGVI
jgi:hypothetical protein